jgi:lysophospholipase L1-like esterase
VAVQSGGSSENLSRRVSQNCKPEGIEQIKLWRRSGELGDRLVLALGTNDAALYPSSEVRGRLDAARKAAGGVAIHLVTAAKLTGPKSRARVEAWNREARAWCAADGNCSMIEWGETKWARDPGTYTGDKVHLSGRGLSKRAKFISETLKKQVSEGL